MKDSKKNPTIVLSIIAIAAAALGFFGGMKYQQTKTPTFGKGVAQGAMNQNKQTGSASVKNVRAGAGTGNGLKMGTIAAMDATSITLKMQDGSSKIVILAGSTTYKKTADAAKTDVKVGDIVVITGTTNSDGSITAENVQLNPNMMGAVPGNPGDNGTGAPPEVPQN